MIPARRSETRDSGQVLLDALEGHAFEGFEQSFKLFDGALLANRFLAGINRARLSVAELDRICVRLGMPAPLLEAMRAEAKRATTVHFGYEEGVTSSIFKVYLEFAGDLHGSRPVLLHSAMKWDVQHPERATRGRYTCIPGAAPADIVLRVRDIARGPSRDACERILAVAFERSFALMYLDVSETENERRSFDINLHAAQLRVAEVQQPLLDACERYGVPLARLDALFARIGATRLAHISAGTNRDGQDFLTVYYAPDGH